MNIVNTIYTTATSIYSTMNEYYCGSSDKKIKPIERPSQFILPSTRQESSKLQRYEDYKNYERCNSSTSSNGSLSPTQINHTGINVFSFDDEYYNKV